MAAAPLSPTPSAALNFSTPTSLRHDAYGARKSADYNENRSNTNSDDGDSSPFLSHFKDELTSPTARGPSPKPRPGSRIISGSELSPLKILQQHQQSQIHAHIQDQQMSPEPVIEDDVLSPARSMAPPSLAQSPRKTGPIKRFPVKVAQRGSGGSESSRRSLEERRLSDERRPGVPDTVPEHEEVRHAIDIFEDEANTMHDGGDHEADRTLSMAHEPDHEQSHMAEEEHSVADDTMISTFSAFSGVPNLTMLAQMRSDSPTKFSSTLGGSTPRPAGRGELPSRTPRQNGSYDGGNTTNLIDFAEQMRYGAYGAQPTPSRRGGHMPPPSASRASMAAATPQRNNLVNLLDFDLPPAPTPRSIPTITPRELESLKSGFLSEISSLKASLSGKEAEALSLKTAVGDAEKRVGECMEQLREVQGVHEALQTEKDSWERRGREMESVLRKVREEIVISQREREELEFKLDEAEKRREAAEMMAQDAESKMAGMRAGKASAEAAAAAAGSENRSPVPSNKEVEMAVERVARDLHGLYKSKHETKVAALKKSYEQRWEKQVRKLQAQVDQLGRENDELRHLSNSNSRHGVDPARLAEMEEERRAERARDAAQLRERQAEVEKVEAVLRTVQADNADLRVLLERERVEKGELVQLAEEMMNMQQSFVASVPEEVEPAAPPAHHYQQAQPPQQHQYQQQQHQYQQQQPQYQQQQHQYQQQQPQYQQQQPQYQQQQPQYQQQQPQYQQQQPQYQQQQPQPQYQQPPPTTTAKTPNRRLSTTGPSKTPGGPATNFRMSTIGMPAGGSSFRASGLRAPGAAGAKPSGIGRVPTHERAKSAAVVGSGVGGPLVRPGSGQGLRGNGGGVGVAGGIMSSIEKMGYHGGGGYGRRE